MSNLQSTARQPYLSVAELMGVLEVSRRWISPYLRRLAISGLSSIREQMTVEQKLDVGTGYDPLDWLPRIYRDICLQGAPISKEEAAGIPPTHLMGLVAARERVRSLFIGTELGSGNSGTTTQDLYVNGSAFPREISREVP